MKITSSIERCLRMKVRELIEKLSEFDQELDVFICDQDCEPQGLAPEKSK